MIFLLQSDNASEATGWFDAIASVIKRLVRCTRLHQSQLITLPNLVPRSRGFPMLLSCSPNFLREKSQVNTNRQYTCCVYPLGLESRGAVIFRGLQVITLLLTMYIQYDDLGFLNYSRLDTFLDVVLCIVRM